MIYPVAINIVIFNPIDHVINDLTTHFRVVEIQFSDIRPAPGFTGFFIDRIADFTFLVFIIKIRMFSNPWMVPTRMMRYPIDDDVHTECMRGIHQLFEIIKVAEEGIQRAEVRNGVVASQSTFSFFDTDRMDRHEPQDIHTHFFEPGQMMPEGFKGAFRSVLPDIDFINIGGLGPIGWGNPSMYNL